MIEVNNIEKSFGDAHVLKGISTVFETGKTNLIIGRSGSGKTVMLKTLLGIHTPEKGTISFDGRVYSEMTPDEKRKLRTEVGMVFQGSALFDSMTVEDNVGFPLKMFTSKRSREVRERVNVVLDRVNLKDANKKFPAELSGGMQKRVAIARAIVNNPKYLFCDEPNSGLDPETSIVIDELIQEITKEYDITTVINTHDMNSVLQIGEKIVFLKNGIKEWEGNNEQILETRNKSIVEFVYSSDLFKKVRESLLAEENEEDNK
ncbi:ATP-binding cassette domain-containing protein [Flavobacterium coralii]|uniref:ABC transporter ATP-binding protein n=1 Tax=Flavobacterium coralii TaxID=2838017 RepID=UPI000C364A88|nr:ATP-binding cassette domain-containing protein [Flavobacterium coralii]MBF00127.1 ABC transporter ATP-binding protein [Flavobacterium sp.]MBY8962853.1 ATP-binding cassette domain-containing protein [Flavobacterium coralii]|tara:strand:- start:18118 stop:18900 length:783 start_codon:yes stop_codon:yes gene_type:complete